MKGSATRGTEIAALAARRNEEQVRSEGSLLGEKRAAVARLGMVAMFAIVSSVRSGPRNWGQFVVGAIYTLFGVVTLIGMSRLKVASPRRALWVPVPLTLIDTAAITTLGALEVGFTGVYNAGQQAIALAIVVSFSVARRSVWHVVLSVACAEIVLGIAIAQGWLVGHAAVFITSAFAVLGFVLSLTNRAIGRMFQDLRRRDNLARFLPQQVADRVLASGPGALAPVEREVTVLFSDIRGFTSLSEGLEPREVLAMLDDYFGRMGQVVKGRDGVIGKFLGDGLLAFWGVPDRLDDHATKAVQAARDMRTVLVEINRHRERDQLAPLKVGIGIHTGKVAAGMLGSELFAEYTIIGDAVNVASRIEGLTKEHGVDVLISETTYAQLRAPERVRKLAEAAIRGRKEPVVLYTLEDL